MGKGVDKYWYEVEAVDYKNIDEHSREKSIARVHTSNHFLTTLVRKEIQSQLLVETVGLLTMIKK